MSTLPLSQCSMGHGTSSVAVGKSASTATPVHLPAQEDPCRSGAGAPPWNRTFRFRARPLVRSVPAHVLKVVADNWVSVMAQMPGPIPSNMSSFCLRPPGLLTPTVNKSPVVGPGFFASPYHIVPSIEGFSVWIAHIKEGFEPWILNVATEIPRPMFSVSRSCRADVEVPGKGILPLKSHGRLEHQSKESKEPSNRKFGSHLVARPLGWSTSRAALR